MDRLSEALERLDPGSNRARALEQIDAAFRAGGPPDPPLDGFLPGRFVALDVARPADAVARGVARLYMPWLGKRFDAEAGRGVNVLAAHVGPALRLLSRRHAAEQVGDRIEAFPFATRIDAGAVDPELKVLKIDYDSDDNPASIRRILDELVQVDEGRYLGKILYRSRGSFRPIGFFTLNDSEDRWTSR